MMICSVGEEHEGSLELEPKVLYENAPYFHLLVRVEFRVMTASIETRVLCAAWHGFVQQLIVLEERGQGEAKLVAMLPEELSLVFRPTDHAGNMGVEGKVGARDDGYCASIDISALPCDQEVFGAFVEDARMLADHMTRVASRKPVWARP